MDKFTKLANSILKENVLLQEESNDLMAGLQSGRSFGDFLRSLTGKTVKDVLDSASYSRLYAGNKFGMTSAANDESNPEVLLSKFLTKLGNFVNRDVMKHRPRIAETEEFKKKYGYNEYLEQEKERRQLFIDLIKAKEGPEKDALRQKKNAFRNTSEYAEAMRLQNKKEDAAVEKFHNTPIEQGELVNDGSQEYKDLEKMYNQIQIMRGSAEIEDQEQPAEPFLTKDQEQAIRTAQTLANDPRRRSFQKDPQKEIDKAYGDVMKKIANKLKTIKI